MLNVFVIDDQKTNRKLMAKLARTLRTGLRIHEFEGPEEPLALADETPPDLVITDYKMPQMTGAEFIRTLRGLRNGQQIPIMVVTAYAERSYRYDALQAGATDFLLNPVDHEEFRARAGNLLTLRIQQRLIQRRASMLEKRLKAKNSLREHELRESEDKFKLVVNTVPALVNAVDAAGHFVYVNDQEGLFRGVDPETMQQQPLEQICDDDYASRHRSLNDRVVTTGETIRDIEETLVDAAGDERVFLTTKAPLFSVDGEVSNIITVSVDITQRKALEADLWNQAHYDGLTALPNRKLMGDRLAEALTRARQSGLPLAVLSLDLDGFKHINDAYGHGVGDVVLQAVADRFSSQLGESDTLARPGGDELVCLVEGLQSVDDADRIAHQLITALHQPIMAAGLSFHIRTSIGIAISGADSDTETVLANADAALYYAKTLGGNRWAHYTPAFTARAQRRIQLEAALRHALDQEPQQLALSAQPVVDVRNSALLGYEMLVRWQHPNEGWIPPNEFVPVAEVTGLIGWLGQQMLEVAAHWAMADEGLGPGQRIAVNISPWEIADPEFAERCRSLLRDTGLPADRLELEITENGLMQQDEQTLRRLEALRADGVTIAIDDFGTGYSSLQYIKALPADRLKIDRSFVHDIGSDPDNQAIVSASVTIAAHFGLDVVAEGIENTHDAQALADLSVQRVQGYYFGRPQMLGFFTDFLACNTAPRL